MVKLVLLRHGQSAANKLNMYTGWSDVPLTKYGEQEAHAAGQALAQVGINFTAIHTSVLVRAIKTANIVAEEIHQLYLPLFKTWRLNERHYGALRGLNKDWTREKFGAEQVALWRRPNYHLRTMIAVTRICLMMHCPWLKVWQWRINGFYHIGKTRLLPSCGPGTIN